MELYVQSCSKVSSLALNTFSAAIKPVPGKPVLPFTIIDVSGGNRTRRYSELMKI